MADIRESLKILLREADTPFFTDEEISFYLERNKNKLDATAYEMLILKSEATDITLPGLTLADSSSYFRRLALRHKPRNTGVLGGGRR